MKLNYFSGYADTKSIEMPLDTIVEMIQFNQSVKEQTGKYRFLRTNGTEREADRVKSGTPCFAVPVRFNSDGKAKKDIVCLTGLSLVDIDHIPDGRLDEIIQLVREDPHTLLAYITISGNGLRILFRSEGLTDETATPANLKRYAAAFAFGNQYYAELTGCECDLKCKNATRLSGLAHDVNVYYNPDAEPFAHRFFANAQNDKKDVQDDKSKKVRKVSPRLLSAIHKELAAQEIAYETHRHNEYIMRTGYLLNAYGVSLEAATEWAVKAFADYDGDVAGILHSCYQQTDEFGTRQLAKKRKNDDSEDRSFYASVEEIESFLDTQAHFRYNVITSKVEYSPSFCHSEEQNDEESESTMSMDTDSSLSFRMTPLEDWIEIDDRFVNTLWSRMCKQVKNVRASDIRAVLASEYVSLFNPFEAYFEGLPSWDGTTDYITELTDTITVKDGEQPFFRKYFKKWLVGVVASILDPKVVNHEILVFIGEQGTYKTSWMNHLLPPKLRRYFYVKTDSSRITKDDLISLSEFAIICLEEIDELKTPDMSQLKALVTKPEINERPAYGHYKERRPHLASFCGTTNNEQFLSDLTGNRRWLPIEVEQIVDPYTYSVNYTGVFSQAVALFRSGFAFFLTPSEVSEVNRRNHRYEVTCMELELIQMLFRVPMKDEEGAIFMPTTHVLHRINTWVKQPLSTTKIGIAMKKAGFEPIREAGKRGYKVIELSGDHIMANARAMARFV